MVDFGHEDIRQAEIFFSKSVTVVRLQCNEEVIA